ncbi:PadR family transcriptional regulator [Pimelobacter simplex]|uniref:PadR family transcriptional regulator n=1 Tax=Nocardioides simplex TaxID=2045 RepID=A0A0A1DIA7_NOCSI|nr:PadR family transcriptional regulator [Pimelobacter simplex]AIY16994.1 Transcriptional regulator, PadR family [Pimelobacter simplex]KAB2808967.1 PadR family transcriptional regulator [Pimelobacter simplex]MCG8152164.1 PadR family transcriptional regulator [Pimelobacter simplex]SFM52374.1 transcriptional regulator, PadR family [Pimelobacter simplex]GEB12912.1 PadR family transcriptional regulator [Pimelobacter simplex]
MALEHAILVSLSERAASGAELTRRFDASIGYFWTATHQQIYRVLGRMETDGWITAESVPQPDRPTTKVYAVTAAGHAELRRWIAEPTAPDPVRSTLGVKMRGASYGDRAALLDDLRHQLDEHTKRHSLYEFLAARDFPDPAALDDAGRDIYLVLRGGLLMEEFWIRWLTEYLDAHTKEIP